MSPTFSVTAIADDSPSDMPCGDCGAHGTCEGGLACVCSENYSGEHYNAGGEFILRFLTLIHFRKHGRIYEIPEE